MIIILKILTDRTTIRYKGYFISTRFMDDCLLNITHYQRYCHQCHFDDTMVNIILLILFFLVSVRFKGFTNLILILICFCIFFFWFDISFIVVSKCIHCRRRNIKAGTTTDCFCCRNYAGTEHHIDDESNKVYLKETALIKLWH